MATVMGGVGYGLYFVAKVGTLNLFSFSTSDGISDTFRL